MILSAGFDTRAHRIAGIEMTRVFEVDHPDTHDEELRRLKKVLVSGPDHFTFVQLDFNTQSLGESLSAGGCDEQAKTPFIWHSIPFIFPPLFGFCAEVRVLKRA